MVIRNSGNTKYHTRSSILLMAAACSFVIGVTWLITSSNTKRNYRLGINFGSRKAVNNISNNNSNNFSPPDDFLIEEEEEGCDAFTGKWVWDNVSRPLYQEWDCPYPHKYTACQKSGRPDSFYRYWKWQPQGCTLPTFDPLRLLNVLRGKRLMFVGDSIQRNQFESFVCMVQSVVEGGKKSFWNLPPSMKIFRAEELNVSIEFFWAPFLVDSNADGIESHSGKETIVHLDSISRNGAGWNGADILVFDTYNWWVNRANPPITYLYQGEVKEYTDAEAYKQGLATWANWLENNVNPRKQQVLFMSICPTHLGSTELPGSEGNCFNETYPDFNLQLGGAGARIGGVDLNMMQILGDTLNNIEKTKVTLLNITQMTLYRIDAHTSYYGRYIRTTSSSSLNLSKVEQNDHRRTKKFGDCMHWCLSGVPDTWNEILYAYLIRN